MMEKSVPTRHVVIRDLSPVTVPEHCSTVPVKYARSQVVCYNLHNLSPRTNPQDGALQRANCTVTWIPDLFLMYPLEIYYFETLTAHAVPMLT